MIIRESGIIGKIKDRFSEVVKSCFGVDKLEERVIEKMYLNVADNGWGLRDPSTYFGPAYISCMNMCRDEIEFEIKQLFEDLISSRIPSFINYKKSAESLIECNKELIESKDEIFKKMDMGTVINLKNSKQTTIQEKLTSIKYNVVKKLIHQRLLDIEDAQELRTIVAISNNNSNRIFTIPPINQAYVMTNLDFKLIYRYMLDIENENITNGTICDCNNSPILDRRTAQIHFARCSKGGGIIYLHDVVKNGLNEILGYSGRKILLEEKYLFSDDKRPDITIQNPIGGGSNICIDCVITGDTEGTSRAKLLQFGNNITRKNMLDKNFYIDQKEKEKIRKYKTECDLAMVRFIPAAFTTKSNWSDGVDRIIDSHSDFIAQNKGYEKSIIGNWAKSKLAFKIARATCKVITDKTLKTQGPPQRPFELHHAIRELENQEEFNREIKRDANLQRGRPLSSFINGGREHVRSQ